MHVSSVYPTRQNTPFLTMLALVLFAMITLSCGHVSADTEISAGMRDKHGCVVHDVHSSLQAHATKIRVLLPDRMEPDQRYTVLYVLPVEADDEQRYGNGLAEIQKHELHNAHRLICVAPTFAHLPWYADHATDATIRQETYFVNVVVPFVERTYPVKTEAAGRLLLGFSKSGWGAFSLLLRHPECFGKAAAWDAPLMMDRPNKFGMQAIFGSQTNFEDYQISGLLRRQAAALQGEPRLIHLGYGNFREHHAHADALMESLQIPRVYCDGPKREHTWHSGWVAEAVNHLINAEKR